MTFPSCWQLAEYKRSVWELPPTQGFPYSWQPVSCQLLWKPTEAQVVRDLGRHRDKSAAAERRAIGGRRTGLTSELNSCAGKRPLSHNSLQKGPATSGTQSSNIPAYQLPKLTNLCVSEVTVSRDLKKDLLKVLGSTSVLTLQGSLVPVSCRSLSHSGSGFVSSREEQCDKIFSCSPIQL